MTTRIVRFKVRNGHLEPVEPVNLVEGAEYEITVPVDAAALQVGSPAAILEAMRRPPHLDAADIEAFERTINEGKLPARYEGLFDRKKK